MISERPLSPHLSVHKKVLTALFSIFHRITGIGLSLGSIMIVLWISIVAFGPEYFLFFNLILSNFVFKIILFFWTVGIFYHLFNGIRYLFWSFGMGMELKTVYFSGYVVVVLTILSIFVVWWLSYVYV